MAAPTIPFGPDTDPLALTDTDWEFVSLDGPQISLENEHLSEKKDGAFLRWAATRKITVYTANYIRLKTTATPPAIGLGEFGLADTPYWVRSANESQPQEGDQTLAVTFAVPGDVTNQEALASDF
jgi:hypothetical protein